MHVAALVQAAQVLAALVCWASFCPTMRCWVCLQALLAIILKLIEQEQQQQQPTTGQQQQVAHQTADQQQQQKQQPRWQRLEAFLRSQSAATSIPFISWLADMDATATGKARGTCHNWTVQCRKGREEGGYHLQGNRAFQSGCILGQLQGVGSFHLQAGGIQATATGEGKSYVCSHVV